MTSPERRRTVSALDSASMSVSVIIPFHGNLHLLSRCLSSLHPLPARTDIIVAADRPPEGCELVARRHGARVVHVVGTQGPASARNRAASASRSDVLIFIDSDVVVSSAALHAMVQNFMANQEMAAVFGTYDDEPDAENFFSQYKNLAHAYVHRSSGRVARSFWAGFGAMRAEVFRSVGGFDERFARPCIEDIELGDRVAAAGHQVLIDRRLHACHLKRWTFRSMIASDIWDRGVPWTQLMLRSRRVHNALNLDLRSRLSVVLCHLALVSVALGSLSSIFLPVAAAAVGMALFLNRGLYVFFAKRRGAWFAGRAAAVNLMYHVYNGFSVLVGVALHCTERLAGIRARPPARTAAES